MPSPAERRVPLHRRDHHRLRRQGRRLQGHGHPGTVLPAGNQRGHPPHPWRHALEPLRDGQALRLRPPHRHGQAEFLEGRAPDHSGPDAAFGRQDHPHAFLPRWQLVPLRRRVRLYFRPQEHRGRGRHSLRPFKRLSRGNQFRCLKHAHDLDGPLRGRAQHAGPAREGQGLVHGEGRRHGGARGQGDHVQQSHRRGLPPARCRPLARLALLQD